MNILLIGGAGYIGSHVYIDLLQKGFNPIIFNRPSASSTETLKRISLITGSVPNFIPGDMCDTKILGTEILKNKISLIIHFAALKSISDSIKNPTLYFSNNFHGVISTLRAMDFAGCKKIIFSSSASVYAKSNNLTLKESSPLAFSSPYANTKILAEKAIQNWAAGKPESTYVILRYFNPIGAHPSGLIGEAQIQTKSNLISNLGRVAIGSLDYINIFGTDYNTPDGTCIRDYLHISDLSNAYLATISYLANNPKSLTLNIGSGNGTSVLEVINAYKEVSGCEISVRKAPRRIGDLSHVVADTTLANQLLGWSPSNSIKEMCKSDFLWQIRTTKH